MSLIAPPLYPHDIPELQPVPVIVDEVTRYMTAPYDDPTGPAEEQIRVVLVPLAPYRGNGKIFVSGKPSWDAKAKLLAVVQAAAERQLTQDELNKLDPDAWLPGKEFTVIGQYSLEGKQNFKVSAYLRTAGTPKTGQPQVAPGPLTQAAIDQGGVVITEGPTPQRTSQQSTVVPAEGGAPVVEAEVNIDDIPF